MRYLFPFIFSLFLLQADDKLTHEISLEIFELQKQISTQSQTQQVQRKTLLNQIQLLQKNNKKLSQELIILDQENNEITEKIKLAKSKHSHKTLESAKLSINSLKTSLATFLTKPLDKKEELTESWNDYILAFRQTWVSGLGIRIIDGYVTDSQQGKDLEGKIIHLSRHSQLFINGNKSGILRESKNQNHYYLETLADPENHQALEGIIKGQESLVKIDLTRGAAFKLLRIKRNIWQEIQKGGTTAYPLMSLALLCFVVVLYKLVQLATLPKIKPEKMMTLLNHIQNSDDNQAQELLASSKGPLAELMSHIWQHRKANREQMEEFIGEALLGIVPKLRRFLSILAVSAAAAPLLGLLGTVMGIIATFDLISVFGTGDASRLGEGISEALITTKLGLLVAIPALIAHAFLNRWVKGFVADLEKNCLSFLNLYEIQDDAE